jgi:hypothetical protein
VKLASIYYILAAVFAVAAWLLFTASPILRSFRRSSTATFLLAGGATIWFGWWLMNLPEPDLVGLPRWPVLVVFVGASVATFKFMPDLLSIRGLGVLLMFLGRLSLDVGFGQLPHSFLSALFTYAFLVVPGLWWAASPPAFVKACDWLLEVTIRHRVMAVILAISSLLCIWQGAKL